MNTTQKSKIDIEEFYDRWYHSDEEIDVDSIEDKTLQGMYLEYVAHEQDMFDLQEKIERYIDANSRSGRAVYGEGDEDAVQQSDRSRYRLLD